MKNKFKLEYDFYFVVFYLFMLFYNSFKINYPFFFLNIKLRKYLKIKKLVVYNYQHHKLKYNSQIMFGRVRHHKKYLLNLRLRILE